MLMAKSKVKCNIQKAHAHDAVKCVFASRVDLQVTEDDERERGTDEIRYYGPRCFAFSFLDQG